MDLGSESDSDFGDSCIDRYEIKEKILGSGTYGMVYEAID